MANLKAYLSFVLLFAFLISSHVLTHELPEGHKHSYNVERSNSKLPTLSQNLEKEWRHGSIDVEERIPVHNAKVHELEGSTSGSVDYHPSEWTQQPIHHVNPPHLPLSTAKRDHYTHSIGYYAEPPPPAAAKSDYHTHSVGYFLDPPPEARSDRDHYTHSIGYYAEPPPPAAAKSDYYTHSVGYQPFGLEVIEPENYEDGSVMRHRKMMRPSEIDRRSFHAFPTKTSSITHGGKTSDDVLKMEDVDEETTN